MESQPSWERQVEELLFGLDIRDGKVDIRCTNCPTGGEQGLFQLEVKDVIIELEPQGGLTITLSLAYQQWCKCELCGIEFFPYFVHRHYEVGKGATPWIVSGDPATAAAPEKK